MSILLYILPLVCRLSMPSYFSFISVPQLHREIYSLDFAVCSWDDCDIPLEELEIANWTSPMSITSTDLTHTWRSSCTSYLSYQCCQTPVAPTWNLRIIPKSPYPVPQQVLLIHSLKHLRSIFSPACCPCTHWSPVLCRICTSVRPPQIAFPDTLFIEPSPYNYCCITLFVSFITVTTISNGSFKISLLSYLLLHWKVSAMQQDLAYFVIVVTVSSF